MQNAMRTSYRSQNPARNTNSGLHARTRFEYEQIVGSIEDPKGVVVQHQCTRLFRGELGSLQRAYEAGRLDLDYFNYVMDLVRMAAKKGYHPLNDLAVHREFINANGWGL